MSHENDMMLRDVSIRGRGDVVPVQTEDVGGVLVDVKLDERVPWLRILVSTAVLATIAFWGVEPDLSEEPQFAVVVKGSSRGHLKSNYSSTAMCNV